MSKFILGAIVLMASIESFAETQKLNLVCSDINGANKISLEFSSSKKLFPDGKGAEIVPKTEFNDEFIKRTFTVLPPAGFEKTNVSLVIGQFDSKGRTYFGGGYRYDLEFELQSSRRNVAIYLNDMFVITTGIKIIPRDPKETPEEEAKRIAPTVHGVPRVNSSGTDRDGAIHGYIEDSAKEITSEVLCRLTSN